MSSITNTLSARETPWDLRRSPADHRRREGTLIPSWPHEDPVMPGGLRILYLSEKDVSELGLTMHDVIGLVEKGLREHGEKEVEMPPKPGIHPSPGVFVHAMPAFVPKLGAAGMKWVTGSSVARERGLPYITGVFVLNDPETGIPLCVMGCKWLTDMRTGAVSAVAAKYLARPDSKVVGIIGAGAQARTQLLGLNEVLDLEEVKVYDIVRGVAERYADEMGARLGLNVKPVGSAEEAVRGSDVVVTAVPVDVEPFVKRDWVGEGVLALPLELNYAWEDEAIFSFDKFVVDDREQTEYHARETGRPLPEPYAELGEIVVGRKPGRESYEEKIMDMNYGLAIHDVVVGKRLYELALEKGVGTWLELL